MNNVIWSKNFIPISASIIIFLVVFSLFLFPNNYPQFSTSSSGSGQYCREFLNDPNSTRIQIPSTLSGGPVATFRLIKQKVPINPAGFQGDHHVQKGGNITVGDENFQIFYPTSEQGRSYDFNTEDGVTDIVFFEYGLVFLLHLDASGQPEPVDVNNSGYQMIDIYQDVSKPPLERADNILKCIDVGITIAISGAYKIPPQSPSNSKNELQLEWFLLEQSKLLPKAWWTPECKPAIYLYPETKQLVNVKVSPKGVLAYTDPVYDAKTGWTVEADPMGVITSIHNLQPKTYSYLYYEAKIRDEVLKKPTEGWVVKGEELAVLFNRVLPELGLNAKEQSDFMDYWLKVLPNSPYYFVGLVDKQQRDFLEPLAVTPAPDTSIRFSLYFERLNEPKEVTPPDIITPDRTGFTLVDWGGMIKNDPNHPFTCSQ